MLYFLFGNETGYSLNHIGVIGTFLWKDGALMFPVMLAFLALSLFIGYLLGSVNFALIFSKRMYGEDIRTSGSGNAGFTNMMRNYGGKAAYLTFVGDFVKTVAAVLVGWVLYGYLGAWTGALGAILGHVFPLYHNFRGGKGIVCLTATLFMLDWRIFLVLFVIFMVTAFTTKYISLASFICGATLPIFASRFYKATAVEGGILIDENSRLKAFVTMVCLIIAVIIVVKHIPNIKRISDGREGKFTFNKSKKTFEEVKTDKQK